MKVLTFLAVIIFIFWIACQIWGAAAVFTVIGAIFVIPMWFREFLGGGRRR